MFCPKCGAEYRTGFTECSDCRIPLVKELPPEPKKEYAENEFVECEEIVFDFPMLDTAIIKSILDSEGIRYYLIGDPDTSYRANPFFTEPVRLMVDKEQANTVREILKELEENNENGLPDIPENEGAAKEVEMSTQEKSASRSADNLAREYKPLNFSIIQETPSSGYLFIVLALLAAGLCVYYFVIK